VRDIYIVHRRRRDCIMNFAILCNICGGQKLVDAAGAARRALRRWRTHHAGSRNQGLRFAGSAGGRSRVHGGSAESSDGEGDNEGADSEGFHLRISPWRYVCLKDF
jgi:hypothetical protein